MPLGVDASVAVKWMTPEVLTDQARGLLAGPELLIAPDWVLLEAASAFWRKVKHSELLMIHAMRHIEVLPGFFSALHSSAALLPAALSLAFQLRHPVYDCLYLVLAKREGARLVTADQQFAARASAVGEGELIDLLA